MANHKDFERSKKHKDFERSKKEGSVQKEKQGVDTGLRFLHDSIACNRQANEVSGGCPTHRCDHTAEN